MGNKHSTMTQVYKVFMCTYFCVSFMFFSCCNRGVLYVCMYTVPILKSSSLLIFVACAALNYKYK